MSGKHDDVNILMMSDVVKPTEQLTSAPAEVRINWWVAEMFYSTPVCQHGVSQNSVAKLKAVPETTIP